MKRIIYTRPDGGLSVIHPAPQNMKAGESETEFLARVKAKDVPADATNVTECDHADIPADRTFRNAWKRGVGKAVEVDMPKAREIHMERIRKVRDAELAKLDVLVSRGLATDADRQKLRDIPQTFDLTAATTPDALKALWPVELPRGLA